MALRFGWRDQPDFPTLFEPVGELFEEEVSAGICDDKVSRFKSRGRRRIEIGIPVFVRPIADEDIGNLDVVFVDCNEEVAFFEPI